MKFKLLAVLTGGLLLLTGLPSLAAQTNDVSVELGDLVTKINAKLLQKKNTEADLADELKQFDVLLAEHRGEKTDEVADILIKKAMLYLQVLDKPEKAAEVIQQLKRDFPDTRAGKNADDILAYIKKHEAAARIQRTLVEGAKFPDFQEKDLAGKPLSVSNYKGKVVLIDFWATWCGPCVRELPNVIQAYEKYHSQGFEIIGISLDQQEQRLKDFLKDKNMTWQQYFDGKGWENKLAAKYGITAIPATFLLDREGRIIGKDLRGEALDEALNKALAKKS